HPPDSEAQALESKTPSESQSGRCLLLRTSLPFRFRSSTTLSRYFGVRKSLAIKFLGFCFVCMTSSNQDVILYRKCTKISTNISVLSKLAGWLPAKYKAQEHRIRLQLSKCAMRSYPSSPWGSSFHEA